MAITVVIYGGAIWNDCILAEIERHTVSSYEEAEKYLREYLGFWLSPERAELTARLLLDGETVLIGWESGTQILPEPPADAEEYDLSWYGDPVYVQFGVPDEVYPDIPGTVFEPYYMSVEVWGDE